METIEQYFGALYRRDDPYGYRDRWYEARKRGLLLATLPRQRFANAWELGCSNGELTAALAERCDAILGTDLSVRAVELAIRRTAKMGNVTVHQATHPADWPTGQFDLIVFSEVGYFLTPAALDECVGRIRTSLTPQGVLVACHWQHDFSQAVTAPTDVHEHVRNGIGLPQLFRYCDGDMLLEAWTGQNVSVATKEGLT